MSKFKTFREFLAEHQFEETPMIGNPGDQLNAAMMQGQQMGQGGQIDRNVIQQTLQKMGKQPKIGYNLWLAAKGQNPQFAKNPAFQGWGANDFQRAATMATELFGSDYPPQQQGGNPAGGGMGGNPGRMGGMG